MKKFLVLFVFIFAFSMFSYANVGDILTNSVDSVYHDGKAVVGTVYGDIKEGAVGIYPDVRQAIISIGKAIGVAAEHVYSVLVKKYVVIGVKQLGICLLGLFALLFGYIGWRRATPVGQPITYRVIVPIAFMIVGIMTLINVNYDDMLMGLINPEYGAINYILDYSKDLVNGR